MAISCAATCWGTCSRRIPTASRVTTAGDAMCQRSSRSGHIGTDCFDVRLPKPCPSGDTEFHPECVAAKSFTESGRIFDSMEGQFAKNGDARKRLVVKMDVEGAEWDSLLHASEETLSRIDQLAIEMHYVDKPQYVGVVRRLKRGFTWRISISTTISCRQVSTRFPRGRTRCCS